MKDLLKFLCYTVFIIFIWDSYSFYIISTEHSRWWELVTVPLILVTGHYLAYTIRLLLLTLKIKTK